MFEIIVIAVLGYIGYKSYHKHDGKVRSRERAPSYIDRLLATHEADTAGRRKGSQGEELMQGDLQRHLTRLCGTDFYLHPHSLLLNHAPGTAFPTAEVDHLAITPFGIFVVETKHWGGCIEAGAKPDELTRIAPDGRRETRRSPSAQNRTKVAFLRDAMPAIWPVRGVGVFSAASCQLDPALPLDLIQREEFGYWLRQQKAEFLATGKPLVHVELARQAVMAVADTTQAGMQAHLRRVMPAE